MIDLATLTISKARKALDTKEFTAVELASAYLAEITEKNPELNVYLEVYDDVLEQAKKADELIAKGVSYPLLGIPLAIKDNILIKGLNKRLEYIINKYREQNFNQVYHDTRKKLEDYKKKELTKYQKKKVRKEIHKQISDKIESFEFM